MQIKQHPYLIRLNEKYQIIQDQILKIRIKDLDLDGDGQINFDQPSSDLGKLSRINTVLHRLDPQRAYFSEPRSVSAVLKYMKVNHTTSDGISNMAAIEGLDSRLDYWIARLQVKSWQILHEAEQAFQREQELLEMFGKYCDGVEFSDASMAINYRVKPTFFIHDSQFDVNTLGKYLTTSEQLKYEQTNKKWFKNERVLVQYRPVSAFYSDDFFKLPSLSVPYLYISHKSGI
ncbi:hypothetical protein EFO90_06885 [Lactiplantibacillus plantarum]|uniref:hypothetical protein n=1 Tax=Lactiplantibacillus plantarum TaxID=1590 RepID=UPI0021A723AF|nr:hypothetical protein [Lactiplantibacillus plantarum]MCT3214122.1 hypothetical protein [Lactiplantibacillus plantarum]MCT3271738.1 hypothetical protein [Lactiplantibacillus plantarum]